MDYKKSNPEKFISIPTTLKNVIGSDSDSLFGDGSDGDLVISASGPSDISRPSDIWDGKQYNNLTIDAGFTIVGNISNLRVKDTLTINGSISANGKGCDGAVVNGRDGGVFGGGMSSEDGGEGGDANSDTRAGGGGSGGSSAAGGEGGSGIYGSGTYGGGGGAGGNHGGRGGGGGYGSGGIGGEGSGSGHDGVDGSDSSGGAGGAGVWVKMMMVVVAVVEFMVLLILDIMNGEKLVVSFIGVQEGVVMERVITMAVQVVVRLELRQGI